MTISDPYAALHSAEPPRYDDPSRPDPFAGFRTVGGPVGLPPRVRLDSEGLLRLAAVHASDPIDKAWIRGLMYRVADPKAPEHEFAELLMAVPEDTAIAPAAYVNPCELRREPEPGAKVLNGNDRAWLDTLDPATLSDDDTRVLTGWYADAGSRSERQLIDRVLAPVRRRHDRAAEEARATSGRGPGEPYASLSGFGMAQSVEELLGKRMAEEAKVELYPTLGGVAPEQREQLVALAEREAHEAAKARLVTLWAGQEAERRQAAAEASARLAQLAARAEPATSAPVVPDDVAELDLAAARRRGLQWRAKHDSSSTNPWDGVRIVGGPS